MGQSPLARKLIARFTPADKIKIMSTPQTNNQEGDVAQAFARPDWYINGYAANIRTRCETVSFYTKGRTFKHVLDVGCGDGSLSLPFLGENCRITFLDLSNGMLNRVAARVPDNLRHQTKLLNGDFTQIDLPPASFDLVLFVGVLAYVPDVSKIADRIRQVIRPGGLLMTECTDAGHFFGRLNFSYRDLTSILRPGKCYTYRHRGSDVVKAFQSAGFTLRQSFRYTYSLPLISRFTNQTQAYSLMRRFYGTAEASRRQRFGSESLMLFELP
jgi:ubiquinone/menaquinone biosynthesis C-methylase UbiE